MDPPEVGDRDFAATYSEEDKQMLTARDHETALEALAARPGASALVEDTAGDAAHPAARTKAASGLHLQRCVSFGVAVRREATPISSPTPVILSQSVSMVAER